MFLCDAYDMDANMYVMQYFCSFMFLKCYANANVNVCNAYEYDNANVNCANRYCVQDVMQL